MVRNMLLNPGEWTLTSPDEKIIVVFKMQKVDYIVINTDTRYTQEAIKIFAEQCQKVFEKIESIKNRRICESGSSVFLLQK